MSSSLISFCNQNSSNHDNCNDNCNGQIKDLEIRTEQVRWRWRQWRQLWMSEVAESFPMAFLVHQVDEGIAQVGLAVEVDGQVEEVILPKVSPRIPKDTQKQKTYKSPCEPIWTYSTNVLTCFYSFVFRQVDIFYLPKHQNTRHSLRCSESSSIKTQSQNGSEIEDICKAVEVPPKALLIEQMEEHRPLNGWGNRGTNTGAGQNHHQEKLSANSEYGW